MVVVRKKGRQGSSYDFIVRKQRVMDALLYKIHNDPYYQDVQVDSDVVVELPENATDISHMLNSVTLPDIDEDTEFAMLEGIPGVDEMLDGLQTIFFASDFQVHHERYKLLEHGKIIQIHMKVTQMKN